MRCRIDFTYALGLDLDDPGFHQSVLSAFRHRLAEGDRADRLLGLALTRIRRAGLLKGRVTQRTDSTHVLSAAREPTCLELVTEAVRAVLEEAARDAPEVLDELATAEWAQRYGRPVRLCSQPSHPVARLEQVGNDARELLQRLDDRFPRVAWRRQPLPISHRSLHGVPFCVGRPQRAVVRRLREPSYLAAIPGMVNSPAIPAPRKWPFA
ncbi:transposase [Streptomyces griseiscabiei]|uniref:Transposase n=1 Tax=Streptomyces griseiscabiei TaxID=2993540 RepID=A0ABU4LDH0_9ACTN|nr:transposase [Streptomyces griseiscabiei]MBZ3906755.1 transposase [Streptomyces griseiscabiei]MDX2913820.1 transposase [Streptomyces griseiscabiei]